MLNPDTSRTSRKAPNGYTPSMELANLLVPVFIIVFVAAIIWKQRLVQIGALFMSYAHSSTMRGTSFREGVWQLDQLRVA